LAGADLAERWTPRTDTTLLYSETTYDSDGNVTDTCPPDQFSQGGSTAASPPGAIPAVAPTPCTPPSQPASGAYYGTHQVYDPAGRMVASTTYRQSTVPACPTSSTQACPLTTFTGYDADGNQVTHTDPNGFTTNYSYDLLDRKLTQAVPRSGTGSSTTYETTTWAYDPSGDVTSMSAPAPSGAPV
jgi:YD repeat-containing protein